MKGIIFFKGGEFVTAIVMPEEDAKAFMEKRGYDAYKAYETNDPIFLEALNRAPVSELRRRDYPPVGDQLDRLTKTLKYLREKGVDIGPFGNEQVDAIEAVKARYPKRGEK